MSTHDRDNALPYQRKFNREKDGQILLAGTGTRKEPMNSYQYPPRTERSTERDAYANPLLDTIEASDDLLKRLDDACFKLQQAIAVERNARARSQDAKETLEAAEAGLAAEWDMSGQAGEGPLASKARTSKAYDLALKAALYQERRTGTLRDLARDADRLSIEAMNASITLDQCQAQFKGCIAAADLTRAVLDGRSKSAY